MVKYKGKYIDKNSIRGENNLRVCAIVPSLNPDDNLLEVVGGLVSKDFEHIIVVNDGSNNETSHYFEKIKTMPRCVVLRHNKNLGKGRALKTAFNYYLNNYSDMLGVVVADGDNQHYIDDIVNCAQRLCETQDSLILGARSFSKENIPLRSRFGNKLTVVLMRFLCGVKVTDTQTGLRAIPTDIVREFLGIYGERYEYETNMLLETKRQNIKIDEVEIKTIYIDDNNVSIYASQGQQRLIALSIKLAIAEIIKGIYKEEPIILLDDVFSELDEQKQTNLINFLKNKQQVFITCNELHVPTKNCALFKIENGKILEGSIEDGK